VGDEGALEPVSPTPERKAPGGSRETPPGRRRSSPKREPRAGGTIRKSPSPPEPAELGEPNTDRRSPVQRAARPADRGFRSAGRGISDHEAVKIHRGDAECAEKCFNFELNFDIFTIGFCHSERSLAETQWKPGGVKNPLSWNYSRTFDGDNSSYVSGILHFVQNDIS